MAYAPNSYQPKVETQPLSQNIENLQPYSKQQTSSYPQQDDTENIMGLLKKPPRAPVTITHDY